MARIPIQLAPVASAGILIAMLLKGGVDVFRHPDVGAYFQTVADQIDALPYRVDDWVGSDVPPIPAVFEILKPNRIVEREYVQVDTGDRVSLLITHCGDARDMLGHYPPVCYPAHGWELDSVEPVRLTLEKWQCPARVYRFHRPDGAAERQLMVVDLFVLPDPDRPIADDMGAVTQSARATVAAGLGVAQIQITSESQDSIPAMCGVASQFVQAVSPVIRAVSEGVPR